MLNSSADYVTFRQRAGRICVVAIVRDTTSERSRQLYDVLANVASRLEDVLFAMMIDPTHDAALQHIALLRTFDEPRLFYRDELDADKVSQSSRTSPRTLCFVLFFLCSFVVCLISSFSCAVLCLRIESRSWRSTPSSSTAWTSRWCFCIEYQMQRWNPTLRRTRTRSNKFAMQQVCCCVLYRFFNVRQSNNRRLTVQLRGKPVAFAWLDKHEWDGTRAGLSGAVYPALTIDDIRYSNRRYSFDESTSITAANVLTVIAFLFFITQLMLFVIDMSMYDWVSVCQFVSRRHTSAVSILATAHSDRYSDRRDTCIELCRCGCN